MKIRLALAFILIGIFCSGIVAQSVVITRKKVIYTRKEPISDNKKTFIINYPKVKAATPVLSKKIDNVLSYESVLGLKLQEELDQYQWLRVADYKVKYNQKGALCVELWMEGDAAYPSSVNKIVVVDTETGKIASPKDVFTNLAGLVTILRKAQDKEKKDTTAFFDKKEPGENDWEILYGDRRFEMSDLDGYEIGAKGVTFHYRYHFQHVAVMYEPSGEFFNTWKQLKPYINPTGLLGQFVR